MAVEHPAANPFLASYRRDQFPLAATTWVKHVFHWPLPVFPTFWHFNLFATTWERAISSLSAERDTLIFSWLDACSAAMLGSSILRTQPATPPTDDEWKKLFSRIGKIADLNPVSSWPEETVQLFLPISNPQHERLVALCRDTNLINVWNTFGEAWRDDLYENIDSTGKWSWVRRSREEDLFKKNTSGD
jgi:hypothetical protein